LTVVFDTQQSIRRIVVEPGLMIAGLAWYFLFPSGSTRTRVRDIRWCIVSSENEGTVLQAQTDGALCTGV